MRFAMTSEESQHSLALHNLRGQNRLSAVRHQR